MLSLSHWTTREVPWKLPLAAMVPQGKGRSMWTKEMGIYPYSTPAKELAG